MNKRTRNRRLIEMFAYLQKIGQLRLIKRGGRLEDVKGLRISNVTDMNVWIWRVGEIFDDE